MDTNKAKSLDRALRFLDLLTVDHWQPASALGAQVGVDSRTIKTYATVFKSWGWPIESRDGRSGGYSCCKMLQVRSFLFNLYR